MSDIAIANSTAEVLKILASHNKDFKWTPEQLPASPMQRHRALCKYVVMEGIPVPLRYAVASPTRSIISLLSELLEQIAKEIVAIFQKFMQGEEILNCGYQLQLPGLCEAYPKLASGRRVSRRILEHPEYDNCLDSVYIAQLVKVAAMLFDNSPVLHGMITEVVYSKYRVSLQPKDGTFLSNQDIYAYSLLQQSQELRLQPFDMLHHVRKLIIDFNIELRPWLETVRYQWDCGPAEDKLEGAQKVIETINLVPPPSLRSLHVVTEWRTLHWKGEEGTAQSVSRLLQLMSQLPFVGVKLLLNVVEIHFNKGLGNGTVLKSTEVDVKSIKAGSESAVAEAMIKRLDEDE